MASVILYCTRATCHIGYVSVGELPAICPACLHSTTWTTMPPYDRAVDGWRPTLQDLRLLRFLRIDPR